MSAIERTEVPVSGGTLATFRLGDGPDGADPVVAVHGITGNSRAWLPVARALEGRAALLAPDLRSSVPEDVIRADASELLEMGKRAHRLEVPTELLCAERGMVDDPNPLQPAALTQPWADAAPASRRTTRVAGVNHYTLVMGAAGARAVAEAIVRALQSRVGDRGLRSAR